MFLYKRVGHRVLINSRGDLIVRPDYIEKYVHQMPGGAEMVVVFWGVGWSFLMGGDPEACCHQSWHPQRMIAKSIDLPFQTNPTPHLPSGRWEPEGSLPDLLSALPGSHHAGPVRGQGHVGRPVRSPGHHPGTE